MDFYKGIIMFAVLFLMYSLEKIIKMKLET